jgi:hypothetical protein
VRRPQASEEKRSHGNDDVILHIHETGRRIVSQLGREAAAESGGDLLTTNAEASAITLPELGSFVSIAIPRKAMLALAGHGSVSGLELPRAVHSYMSDLRRQVIDPRSQGRHVDAAISAPDVLTKIETDLA